MTNQKIKKALFLSTYPPRECGIATFCQDVVREMRADSCFEVKVVAVNREQEKYDQDVYLSFDQFDHQSYIDMAMEINRSGADVLMIQHEYGIFGGDDGEYLLDLTERLEIPYLVDCHTILPEPSDRQRHILSKLCQNSAGSVVMSPLSKRILAEVYDIKEDTITLIHHGVPNFAGEGDRDQLKAEAGFTGNTVISTFGLLSPGKGLEYGIQAIAKVVKEHPEVRYLILGQTHPVVKQQQGEAYREKLIAMVEELGIGDNVWFLNRYLDKEEIVRYLMMSDIFFTPYPGKNQSVSGTLAYAMGCGRVVVATPYMYAEEMLAEGRGRLVVFSDPDSMAEVICQIIEDPNEKAEMERRTLALGQTMKWSYVTKQYENLLLQTIGGISEQTEEKTSTKLGAAG